MGRKNDNNISPLASIHKNAKIGKGTKVGPFAVIDEFVMVGEECVIDAHAVITGHTTIGNNNHVFSNAVLGSIPQDLKYQGETSFLEIGDDNRIRECVTVNSGTEGGGGVTRIGHGNLFMAYSHVAHDCQISNEVIFANSATLAGHVVVEDKAIIAGHTGVHQFTNIGKLSMIAAGSMVSQDVPPFAMVHGDRATLKGINTIGLQRAEYNSSLIEEIKQAYKFLFRSSLTIDEAIDKIKNKNLSSEEVQHIIHFVRHSKRGVCRY